MSFLLDEFLIETGATGTLDELVMCALSFVLMFEVLLPLSESCGIVLLSTGTVLF